MTGASFLATQRTMLALLPTIGGADSERFLDDLTVSLEAVPSLSAVRARKTTDPARRFEVTCHFNGRPATAARALRKAWSELASANEAHLLEASENEVRFSFVTWTPTAWHATGTVIASRAPADPSAGGIARAVGPG